MVINAVIYLGARLYVITLGDQDKVNALTVLQIYRRFEPCEFLAPGPCGRAGPPAEGMRVQGVCVLLFANIDKEVTGSSGNPICVSHGASRAWLLAGASRSSFIES